MTAPHRDSAGPPGTARTAVGLLLTFLSLALYLWSFSAEADGVILGNDVIPYAEAIASGEPARVLSPHHPGHHLLTYGLLRASGTVTAARALDALGWVSALGGALCVGLLFRFAARLCGTLHAALLAGVYATAAGTWLYSAVGESYLPGTAALALCLGDGVAVRLGVRRPSAWRAGALLLLALLVRQDAVLLAPCLALALPWRTWIAAVGGAGLASLGCYALCWIAAGQPAEFGAWLRGLADTGLWGDGVSLQRAGLTAWFTQHALHYGVRYSGAWAVLSIATTVVLVGALRPRTAGAFTAAPRVSVHRAALFLASFVALRSVFFTWWQPTNMEYHTPTLWPLFGLLALGLPLRMRGSGPLRMRGSGPLRMRGSGPLRMRGSGPLRMRGSGPLRRRGSGGTTTVLLALALASTTCGNAWLLIGPNRARDMDGAAQEAARAAGAQGLVASLDRLQHYAQMRLDARAAADPAASIPRPRLLDASQAAVLGTPEEVAAVSVEVRGVLERGGRVLLVRDRFLFPRLALPLVKQRPALLDELRGFAVLMPTADEDGVVWLSRVELPGSTGGLER